MRWLVLAIGVLAFALLGCDNISKPSKATDTPAIATITQEVNVTPRATPSAREIARRIEADDEPNLPGEYIDLPAIYDGYYGNEDGINTAAHVTTSVDYSPQGLPPAGGPHWGNGPCPDDPETAPEGCGPVPWGIYRSPWHPESLVHNMEHAGVVIWYNTAEQPVIDDLELFAADQLNGGTMLVLAPYPDMPPESIAITVWSRREMLSVDDYDPERLQRFIDELYCRFDPEQFC